MGIRVYTTSWCPDCHRVKRLLQEHQIKFEEINIEENEQAAELVILQNEGKRRVPTIEINGSFYGDPPLDELARLVGITRK